MTSREAVTDRDFSSFTDATIMGNFDLQARVGKVRSEAFRIVDPAVPVRAVRLVQRIFGREQAHGHGRRP